MVSDKDLEQSFWRRLNGRWQGAIDDADVHEVVARLRRGDPAAVHELRKRVHRILAFRKFRIPDDEREDIEQETVTQVWQAVNRTGFEAERGFWGFVAVVASRRCIDWLRARRAVCGFETEPHDGQPSPLQETLENEKRRLAIETLIRLDRPCRDVIYLHVGLEKSYRQMSELLGKSEGALRVQMYRCVRAARSIMESLAGTAAAPPRRGAQL